MSLSNEDRDFRGSIFAFMEFLSSTILFNVVLTCFMILGLGVFGFFPALNAGFKVQVNGASTKKISTVFTDIWQEYKKKFISSNLVGLFYVIVGVIIGFGLMFFDQNKSVGTYFVFSFWIFVVIAVVYIFSFMYYFPIANITQKSFKESFNLSLKIPLSHPLYALLLLVMFAAFVISFWIVPFLIGFFIFSAYITIVSAVVKRSLVKSEIVKKENEDALSTVKQDGTKEEDNKAVFIKLLKNHRCIDEREKESVEKTLNFIENNNIVVGKENKNGHITASAFIINKKRTHMLLVYHKKCQLWLQPGGHLEKNESPLDGAIREMIEETGIQSYKVLDRRLFDSDAHEFIDVKKNIRHMHYDMRFIIEASDVDSTQIQKSEVDEMKWVPLSEFVNINNGAKNTDENFKRVIEKLKANNYYLK